MATKKDNLTAINSDSRVKKEAQKLELQPGQIAVKMVYKDALPDGTKSRVLISDCMTGIMNKAEKAAKADGKNYKRDDQIESFDRLKVGDEIE